MDSSTIVSYINLGLTGLFIVIIVGLVIAALIGLKKGVFKSSFILIFMATLICVLIFCLDPLLKIVENFKINSSFAKTIYLSRSDVTPEQVFIVPVTTIKETLQGCIEGVYLLYNIGGTSANAQAFALALSSTIIKFVIFFILMIVIVIGGNFLAETLWEAVFKRFVPKIFRKQFKGKVGGAIVYSVNYLVVTFMLLSPLTSILNTVNQSYQRNKSDNNNISEIGTFLDAYNSSMFATLFFNWTVNDAGLTFDGSILNSVTSSTVDGAEMSLISEIQNFSDIATSFFNGMSGLGSDSFVLDYSVLLSSDTIGNLFDSLINSNLITLLLPIAAQIAVNSSLIESSIDLSLIEISDIDWAKELTYIKEMATSIIDTGVLEGLLNEDGQLVKIENEQIKNTIKLMFNDSNGNGGLSSYESMLNVFKNVEKSKLFNRAISAVLAFALQNDASGQLSSYINLGWDEINDISWGFESYVLIDAVHTLYTIDEKFVDAIFVENKTEETETPDSGEDPLPPQSLAEEEEKPLTIMDLILEHISEEESFNKIRKAIIGDISNSSSYDKNGRSIVLNNGQRIEGRSYCLLDSALLNKIVIPYISNLMEQDFVKQNADIADEDLKFFEDTIDELNSGVVLLNYKNELNKLLDIISIATESESLTNAIKNNFKDFIKDNNPFTIESENISCLQKILRTVDNSKLLYSFATVFVQGFLNSPKNGETFTSIGINLDVMASGIRQDMKKSNHNLFHEIAALFDCWEDLGKLYDLVNASEGDANKIIEEFKDEQTCNSLAKIINTIVDLSFFNPEPQAGDTFGHNENLYSMLEFVFGNLKDLGFEITREDLMNVESDGHKWTNKYDSNGNPVLNGDGQYGEIQYVVDIIRFIAEKDFFNALSLDMKSTSTLRKFANSGEGDYDLPGLLEKLDHSRLFVCIAGDFLDTTIAKTGLLDSPESIKLSFSYVESWTEEGIKLGKLLNSLADLLDEFGEDFLSNFDLTAVDNIPLLNKVLHQLASSDIFKKRESNGEYTYIFGKWLYSKVQPALSSFNMDGNKNLIKDPTEWNLNWGNRPSDGGVVDKYFAQYDDLSSNGIPEASDPNTYYLFYRNFVSIDGASEVNGMNEWCDMTSFETLSNSFTIDESWRTDNSYNALFGSDDFVTAYEPIFELDEIGNLCKALTYVLRLAKLSSFDLDTLDNKLITDVLEAMNESSCLQIAIYNFYDIATSLFASNPAAQSFVDFSNADIDYLVSTDLPYQNYDEIRANRSLEISHLSTLLNSFKDINNSGLGSGGTLDVSSLDGSLIDTLKELSIDLNSSFVFHRNGAKNGGSTVFQSIFEKILTNDMIAPYFYKSDSPKDIFYQGAYELCLDKDWSLANDLEKTTAKANYILSNVFPTLKDMDSLSDSEKETLFLEETNEISRIFTCFDAILGQNGHQGIVSSGTGLGDIDISSISSAAVQDVLNCLNNSSTLYDLVPNFLDKTFKGFVPNGAISGVNFGDISSYYHYSYNGSVSTNYEARYDVETIANIASIIDDYQELNDVIASGNLVDKVVLNNLISGGALANLMEDIHDSYPMHVYNEYNVDGETHLTVFEQIVKLIMDQSTLSDKAYDSTRDAGMTKDSKITANIKAISTSERTGTTNPMNYYSNWSVNSGETKAILDLLNTAINIVSGSSVDASTIDVSLLSPDIIKNLLKDINKVDIISDAVPSFVKSSFDSLGLGNLTTFAGTNYSYYYLPKKVYGGLDGLAGSDTEIDLIRIALSNIYDEEKVGNKYTNISNINSVCNVISNLDGIMYFISNSRILNTNIATGEYNSLNLVGSTLISARGIIMYNLLGGSSDSSFLRYVRGSNLNEKVHALSSIFNLSNYSYIAESRGLFNVVKQATNLDTSTTFDPQDYAKIREKGDIISALIENCYNAYNGQRSYFASEILSNILDESLNAERSRITSTLGLTYGNADFAFGKANYNTISVTSYDGLNETEKTGLQGILDLLNVVTRLAASDTSLTRADIVNSFDKMVGSEIARIYYLSRAHKRDNPSDLTYVLDFTQQPFVIPMYGSIWSSYTSDVYNASFSFHDYGVSLANYLGLM